MEISDPLVGVIVGRRPPNDVRTNSEPWEGHTIYFDSGED
jgi:hypothetical protein